MTDGITGKAARKKSQKRQRTEQIKTPLTKGEFDAIAVKATAAGLTKAAFSRAAMLGDAGPRAQRRAPADKDALLRVLGQLGKVGSNINQIAHRLNAGEAAQLPSLEEALAAYLPIRNAIYEALGLDPKPHKPATPGPETRSPRGRKRRKPSGP